MGKDVLSVEKSIENALEDKRFTFFLQPQANILTGEIVGAEAIVRRVGAGGQEIYPDDLLEQMKASRRMVEVDAEILRMVCESLVSRIQNGLAVVKTSVNLSGFHVENPHAAEKVHEIVQKYQISAEHLEFELPESVMVKSFAETCRFIGALRGYGYSVTIDDFGAEVTGIRIWKKNHFDAIKLDKRFWLDGEATQESRRGAMANIINIAHRLGIHVVCEGVEMEAQCRELLRLGCTQAQGTYFSPPVPEADFYKKYYEGSRYGGTTSFGEIAQESTRDDVNAAGHKNSVVKTLIWQLGFVIASLVFLAIATWYAFMGNRQSVDERFLEMEAETIAEYISSERNQIKAYTDNLESTLNAISILFSENDDAGFADDYIKTLNETYLGECNFSYVSKEDFEAGKKAGIIPQEDLQTQEQLARQKSVVTSIRYSGRLETHYVGVAVPVFRQGEYCGAVYANFPAHNLFPNSGNTVGQGNTVFRMISEEDGTPVLKEDGVFPAEFFESISRNEYPRIEDGTKTLIQSYNDTDIEVAFLGEYENEPYFLASTDLNYNGYHYLVCVSMGGMSVASDAIVQQNNIYFMVLAISFLIAGTVVVLVVLSIHLKNQKDLERYMLLEQFSDTVLFEYDYDKDVFRLTMNAPKLLKVHDLVIKEFSRNIERLYMYSGDRDIVRRVWSEELLPGEYELRLRFLRPDDTFFWGMVRYVTYTEQGRKMIIGKITDIDEIKATEDELKKKAEHDILTTLMNKGAIEANIEKRMLKTENGLMFAIDIDDFKSVNDTYGHPCGDSVLRVVSKSIKAVFRSNDLIGRTGGDELMVFVADTSDIELAGRKIEGLLENIARNLETEKLPVVTISVGIARYPIDGRTFRELYDAADKALYDAKQNGKNQFSFYNR